MLNRKAGLCLLNITPPLPELCRYVPGSHLCGARYPTTLRSYEKIFFVVRNTLKN